MPPPILFIIFSVGFGFFASLALIGGIPTLKKALASKRWPRTQAKITVAEEVTQRGRSGKSRVMRGYKIRYKYVAAGAAFVGHWDTILSSSTKPGSCRFKAGDSIDIYLNPKDEKDSRLFCRVMKEDWLLVLSGVIFGLVSLGSLIGFFVRLTK